MPVVEADCYTGAVRPGSGFARGVRAESRFVCLILLAYRQHSQRPLVVAANRDEFHARPAQPAHWWAEGAAGRRVFGGRDLTAKGTWLAVAENGRLAAVTNWTADRSAPPAPRSRGELPHRFLVGDMAGADFAAAVCGQLYAGFNFLGYDGENLVYASNRTGEVRALEPGVYGLTNTRLGPGMRPDGSRHAAVEGRLPAYEEWPKAVFGAAALREIAAEASTEDLVALLARSLLPLETQGDREQAPERSYSPCFIRGAEYGTRASTAVVYGPQSIDFLEQQYGPLGRPGTRTATAIPIALAGSDRPDPARRTQATKETAHES